MIRNIDDTIVGIVDESCLIYDPEGLDNQHLITLCKNRQLLSQYNLPLSSKGYKVCNTDRDINLPDGSRFEHGFEAIN